MATIEQLIADAADAFSDNLRRMLDRADPRLQGIDASRLGTEAADWAAAAALAETGTSLVARRIGAVYTTHDLARWLVAPGRSPLTEEAVRKRAKQRRLVAFHTDDLQWAFPAWQFDRAAGRLVPRVEVIRLWQRLPHEGFLTSADLAAWMNTPQHALSGTPAASADAIEADDTILGQAVSRLRARAA